MQKSILNLQAPKVKMEYLSIIFQEVYKILFLLVPVLVSVAMIVWLDRRVWAFVQKRQGPNVARRGKNLISKISGISYSK